MHLQVRQELQTEAEQREDATAAAVKLQQIVETVRSDMADAQQAAQLCATPAFRLNLA